MALGIQARSAGEGAPAIRASLARASHLRFVRPAPIPKRDRAPAAAALGGTRLSLRETGVGGRRSGCMAGLAAPAMASHKSALRRKCFPPVKDARAAFSPFRWCKRSRKSALLRETKCAAARAIARRQAAPKGLFRKALRRIRVRAGALFWSAGLRISRLEASDPPLRLTRGGWGVAARTDAGRAESRTVGGQFDGKTGARMAVSSRAGPSSRRGPGAALHDLQPSRHAAAPRGGFLHTLCEGCRKVIRAAGIEFRSANRSGAGPAAHHRPGTPSSLRQREVHWARL